MNINWHEVPFVRLVIPLITGIALALTLDIAIPYGWAMIGLLTTAVLFLFFKKMTFKRAYLIPILMGIWLVLLGYQRGFNYNELRIKQHFAHQLNKENKVPSIILAQISAIPTHDKWTKFEATVHSKDSHRTTGSLLVYMKRDSLSEALTYGDIISVNGYLNRVEAPKNPYQFNYQSYLHYKNIHYQTFVQSDKWMIEKRGEGNFFYTTIFNWRSKCLHLLEKNLSPEAYSVGAALILGYREALTEEVQTAYADTGAIHVLAVSGLHVGIVAMILNYILGFFFRKKRRFLILKPVILIGGLWLFAFLTGGSPSVLRAATMFSFITIGLYINRPNSIYNNLAISAFILLLFDPYLLMSVGFQLSYLAVLGIVYFQPLIYKHWYIPNFWLDKVWQLTTVAIAAQIGTLPVSLYYFHQFPTLFFLSGLIVIPAASVILGLGLLMFLTASIHPVLLEWISQILDVVIRWVNKSIFAIQGLPIGKIDGIYVSGFGMLLLFGLIISIIFTIENNKIHQPMIRKKRVKSLLTGLSFALLLSMLYAFNGYQTHHQKQITIYNSYQNTIIDLIDGNEVTTLISSEVDEKKLGFATENHYTALGIQHKKTILLSDSLQTKSVFYNGSILQFLDQTILIIDKNTNWQNVTNLEVDFVLLRGNPYVKLNELKERINFKTLIFDASNSRKALNFWRKSCQSLQINYHDINEKGAFVQ